MVDVGRREMELLFFDTFSHENTEELNLDLVQFPRPVVIGEVRVIPLQTRVQADVPGGVRLGATNPSNFKLELFVNNLSKPNASTFEMLGVMEYKANEDIQLNTEVKIPTDGLILKGWYNTLTIAIYGVLTNVSIEPEVLPPPPPPQPRKQTAVSAPGGPPIPAPVAGGAVTTVGHPERQDWDTPPQMVAPPIGSQLAPPLAPPSHSTQHPLDYIQQQLQQANIQSTAHTMAPSHPAQPVAMVPPPITAPGQIPMGVPPPGPMKQEYPPVKQEYLGGDEYGRHLGEQERFSPGPTVRDIKKELEHYEGREPYDDPRAHDSRSHDSWAFDERERRGPREAVTEGRSREGSRERRSSRERDNRDSRDRDYRDGRDYRDDRNWDKGRDKEKERKRDRSDYDREKDRDSKERGYDERDRGRGYEDIDSRGRSYSDEKDRGRGFEESRYEGKRERDVETDRSYEMDRDIERDRERGRDDRGERGRDDRGERGREDRAERGRDDRGERGRDDRGERGRDDRGERSQDDRGERAREYEQHYERGREGYRESERGRGIERGPDRGPERDADRGRDWDTGDRNRELERDRMRDVGRDIRDRDGGFRDRTKVDYREMERPREVYMETEAPRSPSRSRSRSFSPERQSSRSRTPSPRRRRSLSKSPPRPIVEKPQQRDIRRSRANSPDRDVVTMKETIPDEPMSPTPEDEGPSIIPPMGELEGGPTVTFDTLPHADIGSPMEQGYMSDGDYEAISSEDEFIDIEEGDMAMDYDLDEEAYSYITAPFSPYQFEMTPLMTFKDVSQTLFQQEKAQLLREDNSSSVVPRQAQQLLELMNKFTSADHHESWVEAMESVPSLLPRGLSYLLYKAHNSRIVPTLMDWALEALDENKAMAQPESAYKVRHLKMGFKLVGALCMCDSDVAMKILSEDVQHKLLDNFQSQYMSFSLKLQIIAALDQSTRLQDGFQWFLGTHILQLGDTEAKRESRLTCYQRAVKCLLQKQVVRVMVAMTSLIKKIHIYEVMNKLGQQLLGLVDQLPESGDCSGKSGGEDTDDGEMDGLGVALQDTDLESITSSLEEITKVFTLAPSLIAQPGRTLPGKMMFETKTGPSDPYPSLYHMANTSRLLESLFFLVSSPATSGIPTLFSAVRSLIQKLASTQHGLLYLGSRSEVMNRLVHVLVQMADYNREDVPDDNVAQQLGLEVIYSLQTLLSVDRLFQYHKRTDKKPLEDQEPVTILHMLYTMTFTPVGRNAVVHVLAMEDNVKAITPFVQVTGNEREDAKMKKSVCAGYTSELLNSLIHYSEDAEFIRRHGESLLVLGESEFSSKLARLKEWLSPIRAIQSFGPEGLPSIIEQLRLLADDILKLPRSLIIVLRILKYLAIAPPNDYIEEHADDLKYRYVTIELYSADCYVIFVNLLQKLSELMLRPWQKGIPRSSEHLSLYLSIIKPCLELVKTTTQYLIMSRGTEFRDLTTLPVLFELHAVMCSVPTSSLFVTEVSLIQRDIIDIVAAYTQPLSQMTEGGEKISQSLWTLAIRDLLKFTMKAPYSYLSGLQILSELLPLPLPLQTREPLSKEESQLVITTRKLWSAHLLPLHGALHTIILTLANTSCQPLQMILRKICWQMSDLASPTATMITQCIMEILLDHMEAVGTPGKDKKSNLSKEEQKVALATRARFLSLLAYLLSQPAIKCTMLRLIGPNGEEKYQDVLQKMLEILNQVSDRQEHVQDQECIVSILQSLCDMEVTLTSGETTFTLQEQVANALPTTDQLTLIVEALLEHIAHPNHKYDTVLPCIRALVMLTEHDYSFYLLKITFEKHKFAIYRLLQRIKFKFSKDSSDCLSTFSTTLEFLRLLVSTDPVVDDMPLTRTLTLTNQELREVVAWTQNFVNHPLVDLQKLLEDGLKEEEALDTLVDSVNTLLSVLKNTSPLKPRPDMVPPALPEPESLPSLFNLRSTYTVTDPDDERLSATFWQMTFVEPEEPDLVSTNLEEMCLKYCGPDFNLGEELKKDIWLSSEEELTKPKKLKDRRKSQEFVTWRGRGMRRPFVAPMRGRGIARGLAAQANRHDPFRSRPPNTSRPPSMHVDDFMKLEKSGQREPSPDQNPALRRDNDFPRGRGRGGFDRGRGGFDRGGRGGGRFFTPPGSFRRDVSYRGRDSGDSPVYNNRSKAPFISPRSFGGRGGHDRQMSGDRRDARGSGRFEPRGRAAWRGNWAGPNRFNKDDRFQGNVGFRGGRSDPVRHQRSFTK